ncbi:DUF3566 domain-containing protein [Amycolatopsis rifamycinica]|uniref:DUF3566 domain-containing protein n=1 Tax=Amycolatopsis rifamycinica TaxID=287986 RepID=A0A066TW16_9PSEU|nr:DUF3566 domain-containing protein [Amycolatopsis rifamycinica]KDN17752.1 hypothetical protein DV20_33585 [Amycolatopsis rifamycinica]
MTPTDNPEAAGSNGTPASPPWQRVDKEGDAEATVKLATEEVQPAAAAERPVVTGSAAPRLFGGATGDTPPSGEVPPASAQRARPSALRRPGRGPRRASLQVKRFDPWSVLKLSLVLGVAMFFVWLVAVGVLYTVLDGMGVWDKLNGTYSSLVGGEGANASAEPLISAGRVFGIAAILGAINIVLVSALATVSAFIYNVSADLAGGLEVTLSERE